MRWLPVPGFTGLEVSDRGHIRRGTRVLRTSLSDSGYLRVRPGNRSLLCHCAVLLAFVGPRPGRGYEGAHKNGQKHDNRLENLEWKLKIHNEADKRAHGTAPRAFTGFRPHPGLVQAVRDRIAAGDSYAAAARATGLHRHSVSRIARGLRHARV